MTYEGFVASWSSRTDEFADRMNSLPKYVVSTTLQKPTWQDTHVIRDDVAVEISRLRQQRGRDMLVAGSTTLVQTLVKNDLVDEYNLLLYPLVLGHGKRLFQDGGNPKLRLVESQTTGTGVMILIYQPA